MSPTFLRRLLFWTAVAVPVLLAAPAGADVPEGWEQQPEDVNTLHALLVLGGIPLLLFVLIALAVYLPAMTRGERLTPGHPALEHQWFGGPRQGTAELESARSGSESRSVAKTSGGGSGSW